MVLCLVGRSLLGDQLLLFLLLVLVVLCLLMLLSHHLLQLLPADHVVL